MDAICSSWWSICCRTSRVPWIQLSTASCPTNSGRACALGVGHVHVVCPVPVSLSMLMHRHHLLKSPPEAEKMAHTHSDIPPLTPAKALTLWPWFRSANNWTDSWLIIFSMASSLACNLQTDYLVSLEYITGGAWRYKAVCYYDSLTLSNTHSIKKVFSYQHRPFIPPLTTDLSTMFHIYIWVYVYCVLATECMF